MNDSVYMVLLAVLVFVLVGVGWWLVAEFRAEQIDRVELPDDADPIAADSPDLPYGGGWGA